MIFASNFIEKLMPLVFDENKTQYFPNLFDKNAICRFCSKNYYQRVSITKKTKHECSKKRFAFKKLNRVYRKNLK